MSKKTFLILFSVILFLSLFAFLFKLGSDPFQDYDEATYASIIDATAESGNILSLKINSTDYWFEKPPLQLWAGMAAGQLFSSKTFAYRFPVALSGVLGILLIMLISYEIGASYTASLIAGLILLTTAGFLEPARQVRMDVPVTVSLLFSFYSFLKARKNPWWYLGIGVGIGVGVMIKSIIGFFSIPIILIWCLVNNQWGWLRNFYFWIGIVLMFVIILPWHIYEYLHFGNIFWDSYFGHHVWQRFNENVIGGNGSNINYILGLLNFSIPWSAFFFIGLWALPGFYKNSKEKFKIFLSLACIILFILSVFLYSPTKLIYYFTPLYPFVALFVSLGIFYMLQVKSNTKWFLVTIIIVSFITASVFSLNSALHKSSWLLQFKIIAKDEEQIGLIIAGRPDVEDVYIYQFPYRETLRYYSSRNKFSEYTGNEAVDKTYFLIVSKDFFNKFEILPDFQKHIIKEYEGSILTLMRFVP